MRAGRWLCAGMLFVGAAARAEDARPFPHRATINLNTGGTFYVEGRIKIPQSVTITCRKEVRIVGRGGEAVLEVEGSLQVRGRLSKEVVIQNVWIEPSSTFEQIRLMDAKLEGGGVRVPEGETVRGRIIVENAEFDVGTGFDVTLRDGEINILGAMFREPVRIRAVPPPGGARTTLKVDVMGCYFKDRGPLTPERGYSGFLGGLFLANPDRVVIRNNRLAGRRVELVDCGKLTFDGNRVDCGTLLIRQTRPGYFKRTKFLKNDLLTEDVRFEAPRTDKRETVAIDKCWFRGRTRAKEILNDVIKDGRVNEESGVFAQFRKINKRPLELAGSVGN